MQRLNADFHKSIQTNNQKTKHFSFHSYSIKQRWKKKQQPTNELFNWTLLEMKPLKGSTKLFKYIIYYCSWIQNVLIFQIGFDLIFMRLHTALTVVSQFYESQVYDEYVIKGNAAILKCNIPSFVSDHVEIIEWIDSNGGLYTRDEHDYGNYTQNTI